MSSASTAPSRLYFPPSLRRFEPRRVLSPEILSECCLGYDLVEALRPRLVVDLGAGTAETFFAFCQAVDDHDIDGVCFAVDPWPGDATLNDEDERHSLSINHHARSYHRGFTYLLSVDPSAALQHFAESSIDLLRIDAQRLQAPLAPLLDAWLPRLAPAGMLFCTRLSGPDPGAVRTTFESVAGGQSALVLEVGEGLGLLRKQPAATTDHELLALLASNEARDHADLAHFYAHAGLHQGLRKSVGHVRFNLGRKKPSRNEAAGG